MPGGLPCAQIPKVVRTSSSSWLAEMGNCHSEGEPEAELLVLNSPGP